MSTISTESPSTLRCEKIVDFTRGVSWILPMTSIFFATAMMEAGIKGLIDLASKEVSNVSKENARVLLDLIETCKEILRRVHQPLDVADCLNLLGEEENLQALIEQSTIATGIFENLERSMSQETQDRVIEFLKKGR